MPIAPWVYVNGYKAITKPLQPQSHAENKLPGVFT